MGGGGAVGDVATTTVSQLIGPTPAKMDSHVMKNTIKMLLDTKKDGLWLSSTVTKKRPSAMPHDSEVIR